MNLVRLCSRRSSAAAYAKQYAASIADPNAFWAQEARKTLKWRADFDQVSHQDLSSGVIAWFLNGKLNATENCIDRHLLTHPNRTALLWEQDEPGRAKKISYTELSEEVGRLANVLKSQGVKKGDRVIIYMPMTPHAVYSMLACARIGAAHSVVFAGFSAEALRMRILNCQANLVITADEGLRGGRAVPLKATVDEALTHCPDVKRVLVQRHTGNKVNWVEGRDIHLQEAMSKERPFCPPELMDSEDTLFYLYTSGSTGAPKGLAHSTGGYLTYVASTFKNVFGYKDGDIFGCAADVGWITGHSYVVYGPLANGATTLLFESIPTYPDAGRYWQMVQEHKINIFYTAPTAIRMLIKHGTSHVHKYDRSSLKTLGSVGEPINPEAWKWYHDEVGQGRCPIVDTWWQTETGGIMISPWSSDGDLKPGAAMKPYYGVQPVLLDHAGKEIEGNNVSGNLCIRHVNPGMARTIFGNHERFVTGYFKPYPGYYFTGDGAHRDEDGHIWITGRVDDVINVSGHRLGTAEIESALVENEAVAEAAVVGFPHEIKGTGVYAYVTLKHGIEESDELIASLKQTVRRGVGPFAMPDVIQITPALPKTRSGKIMRRILRAVAENKTNELGDTSTLADPHVVHDIIAKKLQLDDARLNVVV